MKFTQVAVVLALCLSSAEALKIKSKARNLSKNLTKLQVKQEGSADEWCAEDMIVVSDCNCRAEFAFFDADANGALDESEMDTYWGDERTEGAFGEC